MANFDFSPQASGNPLSKDRCEIKIYSGVDFGTGIANTAVVSDIGDFDKRVLYLDITGVNTGGVSAAWTLSIATRPTNYSIWTTIMSPAGITNTAYVYTINPTGVAITGTWTPLENIKIVLTNVNTGTAAAVTENTGTVNMLLSVKK